MKRNHGDMPVWNFIFKEAFFMPFNRKPQKFNAAIKSVVIGSGDKTVTLGGENVLPFMLSTVKSKTDRRSALKSQTLVWKENRKA